MVSLTSSCICEGPKLNDFRVSLLGYAGVPVLESLPCLIMTAFAGFRIAKIHKSSSANSSSLSYGTTRSTDMLTRGPTRKSKHNSKASDSTNYSNRDIPLSPLPSTPESAATPLKRSPSMSAAPICMPPSVQPPMQFHLPFHTPLAEKAQIRGDSLAFSSTPTFIDLRKNMRDFPPNPAFLEGKTLGAVSEEDGIAPQRGSVRWDSEHSYVDAH